MIYFLSIGPLGSKHTRDLTKRDGLGMDKKGSCFSALKWAFCAKQQSHPKKQGKKKGGCCFGSFRNHEPATPKEGSRVNKTLEEGQEIQNEHEKPLVEVKEEQSSHSSAVAVATAAAAEAAAAAAHAVAKVVRLTESYCSSNSPEECAAIKIQTAFRGYLVRRNFHTLRGLMRLQTLVQGQSVRRQATNTMRCMQALVRVHSQICSRRIRMFEENQALQHHLQQKREKELENRTSNSDADHQQDWDNSMLTKEEIEARLQSKIEAAIKRERALAYAFSHHLWKNPPKSVQTMLMEIDLEKPHWGWSWLDRWMATRPWDNHRMTMKENSNRKLQTIGEIGQKTSHIELKQHNAELTHIGTIKSDPFTPLSKSSLPNKMPLMRTETKSDDNVLRSERPRYSFRNGVAGTSSMRDDESLMSSPRIPNYMASTESAKAKVRSLSTPKQRPGTPDTESISNRRKRLSFPLSEASSGPYKSTKGSMFPHTSPNLKGLSGPSKSKKSVSSLKDLSIESDNSSLTWGNRRPFR